MTFGRALSDTGDTSDVGSVAAVIEKSPTALGQGKNGD